MSKIYDLLSNKESRLPLRITAEDVIVFADLVDDHNPLHLDGDYAAKTSFKRPVVHGILGASVFSKFFGTVWPGEGTLYLKQSLDFKRPLYPGEDYVAVFSLVEHRPDKHEAVIKTQIIKVADGKICTTGEAVIKHPSLL